MERGVSDVDERELMSRGRIDGGRLWRIMGGGAPELSFTGQIETAETVALPIGRLLSDMEFRSRFTRRTVLGHPQILTLIRSSVHLERGRPTLRRPVRGRYSKPFLLYHFYERNDLSIATSTC
ncbi:hypothetical protein EVAR_46627_1 [Eumeta japonica]|uniref:Uncharacterized protein n=1 Tax=Eumeta variegata TaxID=151549 RepID=A0A4C1WIS9_EUMVA|nr:hypothetical protein EVAR_46627_1 [Eumeta japonica]